MEAFFRHFTLPRGLVVLFSLLGALNLTKLGANPPLGVDRPVDFRVVWTGARLLAQGRDPYPDAHLRAEWARVVQAEQLPSHTAPGHWGQSFLYPPWGAALLAGTVGLLPWRVAFPLWYALIVGALLISVGRWWPRILRAWGAPAVTGADLLLVALALKGTVAALLVGQPTFVAFALGTAALRAGQCNRPIAAGLLLGLAAFKITLVLPFAGLLLFTTPARHRMALLGTAAVIGLGLTGAALVLHPAGAGLLPAYSSLTALVRRNAFSPTDPDYPVGYQMVTLTEAGALLAYGWAGAWRWLTPLYVALAALTAAAAYQRWRAGVLTPLVGWLLAALLTLLTTYHLFYDALLLLPLVPWARALVPAQRGVGVLLAATPLLLPINALLDALAVSGPARISYFTLPVCTSLLLLLVLLQTRPVAPPSAFQ